MSESVSMKVDAIVTRGERGEIIVEKATVSSVGEPDPNPRRHLVTTAAVLGRALSGLRPLLPSGGVGGFDSPTFTSAAYGAGGGMGTFEPAIGGNGQPGAPFAFGGGGSHLTPAGGGGFPVDRTTISYDSPPTGSWSNRLPLGAGGPSVERHEQLKRELQATIDRAAKAEHPAPWRWDDKFQAYLVDASGGCVASGGDDAGISVESAYARELIRLAPEMEQAIRDLQQLVEWLKDNSGQPYHSDLENRAVDVIAALDAARKAGS